VQSSLQGTRLQKKEVDETRLSAKKELTPVGDDILQSYKDARKAWEKAEARSQATSTDMYQDWVSVHGELTDKWNIVRKSYDAEHNARNTLSDTLETAAYEEHTARLSAGLSAHLKMDVQNAIQEVGLAERQQSDLEESVAQSEKNKDALTNLVATAEQDAESVESAQEQAKG